MIQAPITHETKLKKFLGLLDTMTSRLLDVIEDPKLYADEKGFLEVLEHLNENLGELMSFIEWCRRDGLCRRQVDTTNKEVPRK